MSYDFKEEARKLGWKQNESGIFVMTGHLNYAAPSLWRRFWDWIHGRETPELVPV